MVKGVSKGYFKDIMRRMKALDYRVAARIIDAQWLGVPQHRPRVIFIGMRTDVQQEPRFPIPLSYRYTVREALPWLNGATQELGGRWAIDLTDRPARAITNQNRLRAVHDTSGIMSTGDESDRPAATITKCGIGHHKIEQIIGNDDFEPKWGPLDQPHPTIMRAGARTSGEVRIDGQRRNFTIAEVRRICSFPDDYVMSGSYSKQWARLGNSVPPLMAKAIADAVRDTLLQ